MKSNKIFDVHEGEYRVFFNFFKNGSQVTLGFPLKHTKSNKVYLRIDDEEQEKISIPEASGYLTSGMVNILGNKVKGISGSSSRLLSNNTRYIESKSSSRNISSTYDETFLLVEEGYTIEEMARERGLTEGTIIKHIENLVMSHGTNDFEYLKPSLSIVDEVEEASYEVSDCDGYLKAIYNELDERYDYNTIRLALIFL